MRKIAANYIFLPGYPLVRNGYVVIDGQQRLTTIYILIKALIDKAVTDEEKKSLAEVLFNVDKFKRYNIDDSSKLKLKPIKSDNN